MVKNVIAISPLYLKKHPCTECFIIAVLSNYNDMSIRTRMCIIKTKFSYTFIIICQDILK